MIMTNAVMENILTRRTIRRFLTKQILEEELQTFRDGIVRSQRRGQAGRTVCSIPGSGNQ